MVRLAAHAADGFIGSWLSEKCGQAYHGGFVEPLAHDPQQALLALVESPRAHGQWVPTPSQAAAVG